MSKGRLVVAVFAAMLALGASVLMVPGARHDIHSALNRFMTRPHLVAQRPDVPLRQTRPNQDGPKKSTVRIGDDGARSETNGVTASSAAQGVERPATEVDPPAGPNLAETDPDADRVRQALALYRKGDVAGGDGIATAATSPLAKLAMEWAVLRLQSRLVGFDRENAFVQGHPDWAAAAWLRRRMEESLAAQKDDITGSIDSRLTAGPVETLAGKLALARQDRARGLVAPAADIVRQVWRTEDLMQVQEASILRDFGDLIGKADHKNRADRLLYKEQVPAALRVAALAGPDVLLLAKARAAVIANTASDAAIAAVPKSLQNDPGLVFAKIQRARRANRIEEASALMMAAPHAPDDIVDGDAWWVERRIVARQLLDHGDPRRAYRMVADHSAASPAMKIEAEFHAGWIALRFMNDPQSAAGHFARIAAMAETPISKARAAYWQGRAAEAAKDDKGADGFYQAAARYPITFYGQLATTRIGQKDIALRASQARAIGDARSESVRVAEYLFAVGARDIALPLALDVARNEKSEAQVSAMGAVVERVRDAWATLAIGKTATQRGMALDETAFPTFGIPAFQPLGKSADLAVVYAIARQESEFEQRSLSSAGARGLMQMMPATAKRTAEHAGVAYNDLRLSGDAAFNAQLGAAHLAELLDEQGGSYILTFAAYNAGGRNVKDWIDAYGDPRKPGVDPIDWIERIPFTETRNYVQRVMENLAIYRIRLGPHPTSVVLGAEGSATPGKGT